MDNLQNILGDVQPITKIIDPQISLLKRVPRRLISRKLAAQLCTLDSPLKHAYRLTYYECSENILQSDGRHRTKFCGYAWCSVCSAIRMGRNIDVYAPIITDWNGIWFVTLTLRTVTREQLPMRIAEMSRRFGNLNLTMKRRFGPDWKAIRKRETSYNALYDRYHHHYHLIIQGEEQARAVVALWLSMSQHDAGHLGQDIRPADKGSLTELLKYTSKLVVDGKNGKEFTPVHALDWIFQCMRRKPAITRYGFKLPKDVADVLDSETITDTVGTMAWKHVEETITWKFDVDMMDWINHVTGECLTEYEPSSDILELQRNVGPDPIVSVVPEPSNHAVPSVLVPSMYLRPTVPLRPNFSQTIIDPMGVP